MHSEVTHATIRPADWPLDYTDVWDAAEFYVKRMGWAVVPIPAGEKGPKLSGWAALTPAKSMSAVKAWVENSDTDGINIGVVCGKASGVGVVDVDAKPMKDGSGTGIDAWNALTARNGSLPSRVVACTPSGGAHLFFRWDSLPFNSSTGTTTKGIAPGIDLRSGAPDGSGVGQAVIAPSARLVDGERVSYAWDESGTAYLPTSADDLPIAPEWLAILACFNPSERAELNDNHALGRTILDAPRVEWRALFEAHSSRQQRAITKAPRTEASEQVSLDHPYVATAVQSELECVKECREAQNEQLNKSAFNVGTLLGGLGYSADDEAVHYMAGELFNAAMEMANLNSRDTWMSKKGRAEAKATIHSGLLKGLKKPRDLTMEMVREGTEWNVKDRLAEKFATGTTAVTKASGVVAKSPLTLAKPKAFNLVAMSQVKAERINWLWEDRFAFGKVGLLCGEPGCGKSQILCTVAALTSNGRPWPLSKTKKARAPLRVLMLNAEDGEGDTMKPRLQAVHANMDLVSVIDPTKNADGSTKDVPKDLLLDQTLGELEETFKAHTDLKVLLFDPLNAFFSGKTDTHNQADVRRVLRPLSKLAEKYGVAIIGVMHYNKPPSKGKAKAADRVAGSAAFLQVARTAFAARPKPDGAIDETGQPTEFVLFPLKLNIAKWPAPLEYMIEESPITPEVEGAPDCAPRIKWVREAHGMRVDDESEGEDTAGHKLEFARLWVGARLQAGPAAFDDLLLRAKQQKPPIAERTLREALKDVAEKERDGFQGKVAWRVPIHH